MAMVIVNKVTFCFEKTTNKIVMSRLQIVPKSKAAREA